MEENNIRQENIIIGGVEIPTIHCDGEVWYPANYIAQKLLLRNGNILTKDNTDISNENLKNLTIDFRFRKAGIQKSKCINRIGWGILIKDFKTGGYNKDQRHGYNELVKHLGLDFDMLLEQDNEVDLDKKELSKIIKTYNKFIQDCISEVVKIEPNIKWRRCSRCGNTYPLHKSFFSADANKLSKVEFMTFCKDCGQENQNITHPNAEINRIYKRHGEEYFNYYKNHYTLKLYEYCIKNTVELPKIIKNKDDYSLIIKNLHKKGYIDKDEITYTYFEDAFNLKNIKEIFNNIHDIYIFLFGESYREYPWKYKSLKLGDISFEECRNIFNNYLEENNISIQNIYEFDYSSIIYKSKFPKAYRNNTLEFVVKYHNNKIAGYKFKTNGVNYYKNKENRIFDLKYFIEEDLKIAVDKIPLYITKNTLQKHSRTLYNILYNGKYYRNIFEWINEIYPNKFIESDFVIGNYRDEFSSVEESQINDILHSYFKNVIYNQLNTDRTISFSGKTPDWIILTDKGCIIVEYFGLYVIDRETHSSIISDYIKRSDNKKEIYSKLDGYKFLYFYPEDLKDNFKGIKDKIEKYLE